MFLRFLKAIKNWLLSIVREVGRSNTTHSSPTIVLESVVSKNVFFLIYVGTKVYISTVEKVTHIEMHQAFALRWSKTRFNQKVALHPSWFKYVLYVKAFFVFKPLVWPKGKQKAKLLKLLY